MNANAHFAYGEFLTVLAAVGSFWLAITIISVSAIFGSCWRKRRERELSAELVHEMLDRSWSSEEIQGVLLAWGENRRHARRMLEAHARQAPAKPPKPEKTPDKAYV